MALCSKFIGDLVLIPTGSHRQWIVREPFSFASAEYGTITVPAGFLCDLNSIPRPFWWVSTPSDFARTGVIHDYAYRTQVPRAEADALYKEALACEGAGSFRQWTRYLTLRGFGWIAYRHDGKKDN
jgi:hypothetical protein